MLTPPPGFRMMFGNGQIGPIPQSQWMYFAPLASAQAALKSAQKLNPALVLIDTIATGQNMFVMPPAENPLNISTYLISGTLPGKPVDGQPTPQLPLADFAGNVFDRGPKDQGFGGCPGALDTNGAHGGIGGENLTYEGYTAYNVAELIWSETPEARLV